MTTETKGRLTLAWEAIRKWSFKYLGGLFMEDKDGVKVISIGRCLLIAVVAWMFSFWGVWVGTVTITPEQVAQLILNGLPKDTIVTGVDILAASNKVVETLPSAAPPLMETVFLTACGYVFGSKIASVVHKRINGS